MSQVPKELLSQTNTEYTNYFLVLIGQCDYIMKLQPAIEIQCYASDTKYMLSLIHSIHGVDYFNVLTGPSDGMELLTFFNETLSVNRVDSSIILENGNIVI